MFFVLVPLFSLVVRSWFALFAYYLNKHICEQNLYVSRLVELEEIEGCQLAISSALDIIHMMLSKFCKVLFYGYKCLSLHMM
jgi:hypothetical protein